MCKRASATTDRSFEPLHSMQGTEKVKRAGENSNPTFKYIFHIKIRPFVRLSSPDPDPHRDTVFLPLDPRIPNPYFWELSGIFLGKMYHHSIPILEKLVFNFVIFVAIGRTINFFIPSSFVSLVGSGMGKNQNPG
jgi:hypothetical protein